MKRASWLMGIMVAVCAACDAGEAGSGDRLIGIGDEAPPMHASEWVQGEPVKSFERGKVYLVEFWATWCGPCRESIPRLNTFQEKFRDKGLVVIGQNCLENEEGDVPKFVKEMGKEMGYRVALDERNGDYPKGVMMTTWMDRAGQKGIPAAFVVNQDGRIAWIGHPLGLKEELLASVLEGTFDIEKAAKEYGEKARLEARLRTLQLQLNEYVDRGDLKGAEEALNQIEQLLPEDERTGFAEQRFEMRIERKDYESAYELARALSEDKMADPTVQNNIAWTIATEPGLERRDLDVAEKLANSAVRGTRSRDPNILDTQARVLFMKGQKARAIEIQKRAVALAEGELKGVFREVLESYKAGRLPSAE